MDKGADLDDLTEKIIGCAIEVHRILGPGLLEQVITYLKLSGCPAGLLINFNATSVRSGLRRLNRPDLHVARAAARRDR